MRRATTSFVILFWWIARLCLVLSDFSWQPVVVAVAVVVAAAEGVVDEPESVEIVEPKKQHLSVGLCVGVVGDDVNDGEEEKVIRPRCRDYDHDKKTCKEEEECLWIPLPECGEDRPCLDLYTNDQETTELFFGVIFIVTMVLGCCLAGWIIALCCCCCRGHVQRRRRIANEQEMKLVQQEIEQRNRQRQDPDLETGYDRDRNRQEDEAVTSASKHFLLGLNKLMPHVATVDML